jgi:LCP family protein required for cell wall assembly
MRTLVLYSLAGAVAAFYAGVAGAAALPYVGAVTSFVSSTTAAGRTATAAGRTPSSPLPGATSAPRPSPALETRSVQTETPSPRGTPTTARSTGPQARAHTTPTRRRLALAVQRLAASSTLPRRRINFLILGSDNDAKFASYAAPLTQVMIVLSIDPVSHAVTLLSIPRDFWVHIPGYRYNAGPDGTVGWGKIDAASMLGFASAACTVEHNFGIPIDHWVWVGLKGFIRVVDSIGGVTLDVTHPVIDDTYPDDLVNPRDPYAYRRIYIPPGPQHLGGDAALRFVRSRHGDVQGDFGRSQRQQIMISQLRRLLMSQDGVALVALAPALLKDFQGEIKTDIASPDLATAAYYWSLLRSVAHARITQVVLSPPYSTPEYWVTDTDPQVVRGNGGQPLQEDAVLPNWPLINQKIKSLFGAQYFNDPQHYCASAPGASTTP